MTINPVNDAPTAGNDSYSVNEDNTLTVNTASGVLSNDMDIDGNALSAVLVAGTSNGSLTLNADGSFVYTPNANYNGPDSFTYKAKDADNALSGEAAVTITVNPVNDNPTANNDSTTVAEDSTNNAINVLTNDSFAPDTGETLTVTAVTQPANGAAAFTASGVTYTPAANFNGSDSFTYTISDGNGGSATATVNVTVTAVNDAPVPNAQNVATDEDTPLGITLTGSDVDGDSLTYSVVGNPSNGTLGGTAPNLTYTPNANFNGTDSFTFKANDGTTDSNTATISITVNAVNDAPGFDEIANQNVNEDAGLQSVSITNVSPGPANESSQTVALSATSNNTALIPHPTVSGTGATRALNYTPAANMSGTATITVTADDGQSANNTFSRTFVITVAPVNDAPTANDGAASTMEETPVVIDLSNLVSDLETADANLTYTIMTGPANGTLSNGTGANRTYTPNLNYNGSDSFTYKVTDRGDPDNCSSAPCSAALTSAVKTVTITVNPVNDAPTAGNNTPSQNVQYSDQIAPVTIAGTDVDSIPLSATTTWKKGSGSMQSGLPAGLTLSSSVCSPSGAGSSCTWTVSGNANVAPDTYTIYVTVSDGLLSATTSFTIIVTQENATAVFSGATYFATASPTSNRANITLSTTVTDAADGNRGDIRNAQVEFRLNTQSGTLLGSANVGLVNPLDSTFGTATATNIEITLTNNEFEMKGTTITVCTVIKNYYTSGTNGCGDMTTITISVPGTDGVTGGGHLVLSSSSGQYAGENGSKMNFGFTMKYNNSGRNLKGQANIIVRSNGRIYQIKSNAVDSLATPVNNVAGTATFTTKANMKDITNPLAPIDLGGNLRLQVDMTDAGTGGQNDKMGITLWDANGGLFFSSRWNGIRTDQQLLGGGNISVRSQF